MQILSSLCCWRCCCCFYCCRVPVLLNFSCSAIFGSLGALLIRVFWSRLCSPAQSNFQIAVNFLPAQELLPCTLFTPFPGCCCWCSCLSYEKFAACKSCCQYQKLSSLPERKTFNNWYCLALPRCQHCQQQQQHQQQQQLQQGDRNNDDDIGSNIQYCHNNNLNLAKYFRLCFANFIGHNLTLSCCYCSSSSCCCFSLWIWKEDSFWALHKFTG